MTIPNFDPDDYFSWPDEWRQLHSDVGIGLQSGDLMPLREYLVRNLPIDEQIRGDIIRAIDGGEAVRFQLGLVGAYRGVQKLRDEWDNHDKTVAIGMSINKRLRDDPNLKVESALNDALKEFGVGRTKALEAYKLVKDQLDSPNFPQDWAYLMSDFPEKFDRSPEGTVSWRPK